MKNMPLLFCGIFFALAFSYTGLLVSGNAQLGGLEPSTETLIASEDLVDENGQPLMVMPEGEPLFPRKISGIAQQGRKAYIDLGCMYCHSQQVRRKDFGADIDRGWGPRATVARDYVLQDRVLLGTIRTGPDLTHLGGRYAGDAGRDWNHLHLYNPQIVSKGSTMPPFAFLYRTQEIVNEPSADALQFPPGSEYAPEPGFEVVPTRRAEALVEYLLSLKIDYSLPEAIIPE